MEDNRIQNQIAIYMTNKKLCEFTDKLKPAPIEYYYQESNPYWVDYQLAMDRFTPDYDYTNLATFYVDLVEYLVMAVRLYFFIREQQFRPIDRGKYDELVGIQAVLQKPA